MATSIANSRLPPAAALLRNSRLFALPPPIVLQKDFPTTTPQGISDTATPPYPTHAAIQTTDSSRTRGDWGFKRNLPLRSTIRTSNPIIRVKEIDTITHITDFESAADHALTLKKWQALDPVMKMPNPRAVTEDQDANDRAPSVFEDWVDNIQDREYARRKDEGRWVFQGPWIAGQTDTDFSSYLKKNVRSRKAEFHEFLRDQFTQEYQHNARRIARDQGDHDPIIPKPSEKEFKMHLKSIRTDREELGRLIHRFLDLAPTPMPATGKYSYKSIPWSTGGNISTLAPAASSYAFNGPPLTHPSAGFSYLRTRAIIPNHPTLGPQTSPAPVQARVLQSKTKEGPASIGRAIFGVGGLTTGQASRIGYSSRDYRKGQGALDVGITTFDPEQKTGAKHYVHPSHVHVDSRGHIQFKTTLADQDTLALHTRPKEDPMDLMANAPTQVPILSTQSKPRSAKPLSGYGLESQSNGRAEEEMRRRIKFGDNVLKGGTKSILDVLDPQGTKRFL